MNRQERMKLDGLVEEPVEFYGGPIGDKHLEHHWLSNWAKYGFYLPHPFVADSMTYYPTGEHRYQAMRARTIEDHDRVLRSHPARQLVYKRDSFEGREGIHLLVLKEITLAKALTYRHIIEDLLKTEGQPIWCKGQSHLLGIAVGDSYVGKNLLGEAWMQTRDEIYMIVRKVGDAIFDPTT